jgi:hypothetical protein
VVGAVVGLVVGPVVGGDVIGVVVTTVVAVVGGDVVGVVVTIVVTVVIGGVVGVGVVPVNVSGRFCAVPDWKKAVWSARVIPSSQKVIVTGPPSISSFVAKTLSRGSNAPDPPYIPVVVTRISPAFREPILALIREPEGTGCADDVACP